MGLRKMNHGFHRGSFSGGKRESEQNDPQFSSRVGFPFVGWFLLHLYRRGHIPHERGGARNVLEFHEGEFGW